MLPSPRLAPCLALSLALVACGENADTTAGDDSSGSTSGDATGDASTGGTSDTPTSSATDGSSSTTEALPSPWDGEPFPDAPPGQWQWVAFPEAHCRDGSETGIGLRRGTGDGLMIYFEGGGACFNTITCATNPSSYGEGDFNNWSSSSSGAGIFDTDATKNPVGDWSAIYVPYCTGDVHSGDNTDVTVPDVAGTHQFVGYANVAAFLERIVPTFDGVSHVLVTGQSAGGFGAAFNYDRIADAFPGTTVTLLDDSGPPLADDILAPCLQQQWRDLWGMNKNLPEGCTACFQPDGGGIVEYGRYLGEKHGEQHLALISSTADSVIRFFFGFGADDCTAVLPNTPSADFKAALIEARDQYFNEPAGVWGTYFVDGTDQHTFLSSSYYTATVQGTVLVDWVRDLIDGKTAHLGP